MREIIVDNFAGGGGASTGIEMAIGRSVDIAINHDPEAIAMHRANHPATRHYCESVWDVDPIEACDGSPVALAWFSPDCKHFSKAKGGRPVDKSIRGLAWVAVRWARLVHPRVIMLENVEEFQTWGPLLPDGRPDPSRKGRTFRHFVRALRRYGYTVDWRELRACDYGAPTTRKRFFLVARCDGEPIIWPEPTHGDPDSLEAHAGVLKPWRTAAEIIDWSLECKSIFEREKPLCENTMRRIAKGIKKFVIDNPYPFVVHVNGRETAPVLIQYHSEQSRREVRGQSVEAPLMTADASNRYGLVSAVLRERHSDDVEAFLVKYYGQGDGQPITEPLHTVTARDRFGLVVVRGIADIGMRMLEPRELFNAQGFPKDYIIDRDAAGQRYPKKAQVARCGNSVPPPFAEALTRANLPELCVA